MAELKKKTSSPERDAARQAAFEDDPNVDSVRVTYHGVEYEMRAPSLKAVKDAQTHATHDGEVDQSELTIRLLIGCAYVPATGEKVFEPQDLQAFLERPSTSSIRLMKALGDPLNALIDKVRTLEEAEKNSSSAPA